MQKPAPDQELIDVARTRACLPPSLRSAPCSCEEQGPALRRGERHHSAGEAQQYTAPEQPQRGCCGEPGRATSGCANPCGVGGVVYDPGFYTFFLEALDLLGSLEGSLGK